MSRPNDRELREQLIALRVEHRELDDQIIQLEARVPMDQVLIRRLKKRKLQVKDQMTAIEDQLTPDIIA